MKELEPYLLRFQHVRTYEGPAEGILGLASEALLLDRVKQHACADMAAYRDRIAFPGHLRGATVLEVVDERGNLVCRTFAFCGPRDQFSRKKGRAICMGRAVKLIKEKQKYVPA